MQRLLPSALVLVFVATLVACQPAPSPVQPRTINVTGEAELSVAPEIAIVELGVESRGRNVEDARAHVGKVVESLLQLTDELGISREQVQSTELRVQPQFDWVEGRQEFRGYLVHRDVRVRLEELSSLGSLLERAMEAGANSITPPQLQVREPRELHRKVLQMAATDARRNAAALAETLDVEVGQLRTVTAVDGGDGPRPVQEAYMRSAAASGKAASYESGQITERAQVHAEFEVR